MDGDGEHPDGPDGFGAAIQNLGRAIDEAILPGSDRFTLEEAAERAGVDAATTRRLWRALGFADPRPGDRIAGERDVEVLRLAMDQTLTSDGVENLVQQTRIMSAAVSRITELWVDQVRVSLDSGAPDIFTSVDAILWDQDRSMWMLGYMHRRLLAAGLRRELASRSSGSGTERCAVFADLVGFTTLTERLGPLELSRLIGTFEAIAYDTVAEHENGHYWDYQKGFLAKNITRVMVDPAASPLQKVIVTGRPGKPFVFPGKKLPEKTKPTGLVCSS